MKIIILLLLIVSLWTASLAIKSTEDDILSRKTRQMMNPRQQEKVLNTIGGGLAAVGRGLGLGG